MSEHPKKEEGQVAYEAYREACPVSKFTGDKLPLWENIDPGLKPYWRSVEQKVVAHYYLDGIEDSERLRQLFDGRG